ncbi:MAG: sigma-70 family RNA polymerase sigma factor [Candidatus Poribacteria bacterium]|nr:sigma-70 family RNA polymerase sigma factor [Candidatus Poribacteria bacterium]
MKNNDVELIDRILDGDETAFTELVTKYQRAVHALVWRKIGDFHIAEELTQDTFLKAYKKLETLKNPQRFASWLYVIATRRCIAWLRKKRIWMQPLDETNSSDAEKTTYSQHFVEEKERIVAETQREVVKKLLAKLPESDRTVITLYYFSDMSSAEIGAFLGVSANTIRSRLRRAQQRLQKEETMIREALEHFQISPHLTDNIMQEIAQLKPAVPSITKPLLPWVAAVSSAVLIMLMLGIGSQYFRHFQRLYSLDAQAEMKIELVDTPVVLNLEVEPDIRNQFGENSDGNGSNSSAVPNLDTNQIAVAQEVVAEDIKVTNSQWMQVNSPSAAGPVWSLSTTPEGEVYTVLDYAGICRLSADGESWQLLTSMEGSGYSSTAHIGKWNNTLYFTPGDELLVSTDEGKTWESVDSPISQGRGYYNFVFTDHEFYLRVELGGVYRFDVAGKSWEDISFDKWYGGPRHLVAINNTLIANKDGGSFPGLYRFNGNTWEHLQLPRVIGKSTIKSIVATENTLYIMVVKPNESDEKTKQQRSWWLFRSTDIGNSWTDITPTNAWSLIRTPPKITIVAVKDTVLVIGDHDVSVARTIDKGNTWIYKKNTGISRKIPKSVTQFGSVTHAVAVNDKTFYVGGTSGIHRTIDGGKSWHRFNTGLGSRVYKVFTVRRTNNNQKHIPPTLYAITENKMAAGDLVKSIDGGKSWETVYIATPFVESDSKATHKEVYPPRIVKMVTSGGVIYAKGETYGQSYKTLMYRISDDGNTLVPIKGIPTFDSQVLYDELEKLQYGYWNSTIEFPPDKSIIQNLQKKYMGSSEFMKEAAMAPGSEILQRGLQGTFAVSADTFYMEYNHKLFRWRRGEKEWHDIGVEATELNKHAEMKLAVSDETVYVGTRDGKLLKSINSGDTWKDITPQSIANLKSTNFNPLIGDIVIIGSTVYVSTHQGVLMSNDGNNWHAITDAEGEQLTMAHLATSDTTLYGMSGSNRFYRLASNSSNWEQVATEIQGAITSFTVEGNVLYVGTSRRGVLRFDIGK